MSRKSIPDGVLRTAVRPARIGALLAALGIAAFPFALAMVPPAAALSELQSPTTGQTVPIDALPSGPEPSPTEQTTPPPDRAIERLPLPPLEGEQVGPDGGLPDPAPPIRRRPEHRERAPTPPVTEPAAPQQPASEVFHDLENLPPPVARMRELIRTAALGGEPQALRALLGRGPTATQISIGDIAEDPVEYLQSISGDGEGLEILAIILDILDAGYVRLGAGTAEEIYVWPYFVISDLDTLSNAQKVEILRIVTAGDLEDMKNFGAYNFFRLGITPDGQWQSFLAGD
ncbi:hypothetical protein [Pseudohoeflea coraliihabitans]|uniref:Uncharacterized protein n=1 Tax=Pseudohoeflea coraliihabitans TaxID=2860393 RepID=A0ABS6WPI7_9HYPH|nr:hypothetical protein [Pseudohoeflea sp. DP4N28-3]MBW3097884.1 hypothetical protein [Pseudohoeflea sp. DP4N28-3]